MFQPEKECRSRTTSPIRITRARQSLFELPVAKPQRRRQVQLQSLPRAERPKHNPASLDSRVAPEKAEARRRHRSQAEPCGRRTLMSRSEESGLAQGLRWSSTLPVCPFAVLPEQSAETSGPPSPEMCRNRYRRAETENTRLLPVGILARWLAPERRTMPVQL